MSGFAPGEEGRQVSTLWMPGMRSRCCYPATEDARTLGWVLAREVWQLWEARYPPKELD